MNICNKCTIINNPLYGWMILILLVVFLGIGADLAGNNYELKYENIEIATGPNKTEQKTLVSVPKTTQGLRLLANFLYGLSVTLFVSIFVARKLEADQKRKHEVELDRLREAINVNVFDALFKTLIPDEIFQIVKTEIIENRAVRKKAHWTFVFQETNAGIKLTSTSHYELHNVSKEPDQNPVYIEIDPFSSDTFSIDKARCLSSDGIPLVEYDPSNIENNRNIEIVELENGGKRISYTVLVPPNNYITSTLEFSTTYKRDVYDCQYTKYPIIDLNISAVFPVGYKFKAIAFMSNELRTISEGATHKNLRVDGGVLPRQGIVFSLEKVINKDL